MRKERLSLWVLVILMLIPSAFANGATSEVENAGNVYMAAARQLIAQNTCQSLDLAKQNIEAYESLRKNHPGELFPREDALKEINSLIKKYCSVSTASGTVIVYTTAPIVTGNGGTVTCSACSGPDPDGLSDDVLSCTGCAKPDLITLAVLYMTAEERTRFINSADPELRDSIRNFEKSNPTIVDRINALKLKIAASATPGNSVERPGQITPKTVNGAGTVPTPTDKPVTVDPTITPGTVRTPTTGATSVPSSSKKP